MTKRTALIVGASGLVGKELLQLLLTSGQYDSVVSLSRSPLGVKHSNLIEVVIDFTKLEEAAENYDVDDIFCCLGTTIKKARSKEVMYKIDVDYPLQLATLYSKRAKHFLIISSMSANPNSPIWYSRMKGRLEEQLHTRQFESLSIFRPSLLLGERQEFRLGESLAAKGVHMIEKVTARKVSASFAVQAKNVALAMYRVAQQPKKGTHIYHAREIELIAISK